MADVAHITPAPSVPAFTRADYVKMREIAKAVHDDPSLLAEFAGAPEATARAINGFVPPAGYHIHIADADNRFYPAEEKGRFGDADRDEWSRIEFRAGYKTFSLVGCM
jgi:hypothetical protein